MSKASCKLDEKFLALVEENDRHKMTVYRNCIIDELKTRGAHFVNPAYEKEKTIDEEKLKKFEIIGGIILLLPMVVYFIYGLVRMIVLGDRFTTTNLQFAFASFIILCFIVCYIATITGRIKKKAPLSDDEKELASESYEPRKIF